VLPVVIVQKKKRAFIFGRARFLIYLYSPSAHGKAVGAVKEGGGGEAVRGTEAVLCLQHARLMTRTYRHFFFLPSL
jgi:hypothetical protein